MMSIYESRGSYQQMHFRASGSVSQPYAAHDKEIYISQPAYNPQTVETIHQDIRGDKNDSEPDARRYSTSI